METIEVKDFIYKFKIEEHKDIKESLLDSIKSMGKYSIEAQGQKISNSDWHLDNNIYRPYFDIIFPIIEKHINTLNLQVTRFWFQQYEKGDFHTSHAHANSNYSSVYFLELPNTSMKTSFKDNIDIEVEEGDYIVFPAHFPHESKENPYNKRKTSIVFNLSTNDIYK